MNETQYPSDTNRIKQALKQPVSKTKEEMEDLLYLVGVNEASVIKFIEFLKKYPNGIKLSEDK